MARTVKHPEERKKELLETAMKLFAENGYDNVSVRSVAREAHVAPGLAYHYFDSKQTMFEQAIEHYSNQCAKLFNTILEDESFSLDEKIERIFRIGTDHSYFPHKDFFHNSEQGALHDRLSLGICKAVLPHAQHALELDALLRGCSGKDAETLAGLLTYGWIHLASKKHLSDDEFHSAQRYTQALLKEFRSEHTERQVKETERK